MHDIVDLRSDTLTLPTPEMREAMARADVGDDVWEEDPTVKRLEALAASRVDKAAGLFVTSGTMGNLLSVLSHTRPGQEVVLGLDSHIFNNGVGGPATIGGLQMRPGATARGFLSPEQVREAIRPANIHIPPTGLVAIENTHNRHGGTCCTPEEIAAVAAVAHEAGVPVHLDGARLFNAAVALGRPAADFTRPAAPRPPPGWRPPPPPGVRGAGGVGGVGGPRAARPSRPAPAGGARWWGAACARPGSSPPPASWPWSAWSTDSPRITPMRGGW